MKMLLFVFLITMICCVFQVDPFHTLFGIAGLSLLGSFPDQIKPVNPIFCMPEETLDRIRLKPELL